MLIQATHAMLATENSVIVSHVAYCILAAVIILLLTCAVIAPAIYIVGRKRHLLKEHPIDLLTLAVVIWVVLSVAAPVTRQLIQNGFKIPQ